MVGHMDKFCAFFLCFLVNIGSGCRTVQNSQTSDLAAPDFLSSRFTLMDRDSTFPDLELMTYKVDPPLALQRGVVVTLPYLPENPSIVGVVAHSDDFLAQIGEETAFGNSIKVPIVASAHALRQSPQSAVHGRLVLSPKIDLQLEKITIAAKTHDAVDTVRRYHIGKMMGHGSSIQLPIIPQEIDQITVRYHGDYNMPVYETDGSIRQNTEGQPMYRDGMYAQGYVHQADGVQTKVSQRKFVNRYEIDNWHDLESVSGDKLSIDFFHSRRYENQQDIIEAGRKIALHDVMVRYRIDTSIADVVAFDFATDDQNPFDASAIHLSSGERHAVDIAAGKRITRIDVRWGDAKRGQDGHYRPGVAKGKIYVNTVGQGRYRNVARIETQTYLVDHEPNDEPTRIEVEIKGDVGRIFWLKVYTD